jgi:hypothetical protein
MTAQLDLFAGLEPPPVSADFLETFAAPRGRCGLCRWMDCTLPGCFEKLGRCTNPAGRSYWLNPENTRACPVTGRLPDHGSWHWVASDSCACDKVAKR